MSYKKDYAPGKDGLLKLFSAPQFDTEAARHIIAEIPDINQPILSNGSPTTYLFEAESHNNI